MASELTHERVVPGCHGTSGRMPQYTGIVALCGLTRCSPGPEEMLAVDGSFAGAQALLEKASLHCITRQGACCIEVAASCLRPAAL